MDGTLKLFKIRYFLHKSVHFCTQPWRNMVKSKSLEIRVIFHLMIVHNKKTLWSRVLACGAEGSRFEITFDWVSRKLSLFNQQQMGTRLLQSWWRFRQRRERRWEPTFTCHVQWHIRNPNIHCPYGQPAMGLTFTFTIKMSYHALNGKILDP